MRTARSSSSISAGLITPTPSSDVPEADEFVNDAISVPFTAESTTAGDAAATQKCRDRLAATGVDLAAYNTAENAADIADLRVALGIDTWNVYGVSYGSNLALSVLRDHPQGIRSVVLDSVSPPANNIVENWWTAPASSFKAIFAACAAQPSCARAYPNLAADFTATVNRLDKTPVVVQTTDAVRRAGDREHRRIPLHLRRDHGKRARRRVRRPQDDHRHGARRCRLHRRRHAGVADAAGSSSAWAAWFGPHRVLLRGRQSDDRGSHAGQGQIGTPGFP